MNSWIGHTETDLVSRMGAPNNSHKTTTGNKILTWNVSWGRQNLAVCKKSFTIDKSGKVVKWSRRGCGY